MSKNKTLHSILMTLSAWVLSAVFFPLAAAPMAVVLRLKGTQFFAANQIAVAVVSASLGQFWLTLIWCTLSVLVFFLREALRKSHSKFDSGTYSVLAATLVFASLFAAYNGTKSFDVLTGAQQKIEAYVAASAPLTDFLATNSLSVADILKQSPSLFIVMMMFSVLFALLLGRGKGKEALEGVQNLKLNSFRVPDAFVFVLFLALAGTFIKAFNQVSGLEVIAANLLNVCAVVYAFQGIAIVARYFELNKVTLFWRIFAFFVLLVQLPVLLGTLGFLDYWINFRERFELKKRASQEEWRKQ